MTLTNLFRSIASPFHSNIRTFEHSNISPVHSNIRTFEHSNISSSLPAFTLIELLVVISMIAVIMGALTTSVSAARARAREQKATAEVKAITQAILGYESWNKDNELEPMEARDADSSSIGFLLGQKTGAAAEQTEKIPVLLMAQLKAGGKMVDPWGTPYKITIRKGTINAAASVNLSTGYALPNFYRLAPEEL